MQTSRKSSEQPTGQPWLRFGLLAVVAGLLVPPLAAWACNVPVYRYAIEHWAPDAYRVVVVHQGPLSEADLARVAALRPADSGASANVVVQTLDLSDAEARTRAEALSLTEVTEPQVVVLYPAALRFDVPLWTGALSQTDELTAVFDSPVRRELLKRLIGGQTAVWVFVGSGDAEQDEPAFGELQKQLDAMTEVLKLPELTDAPEDQIQGGPDLKIDFSTVQLSRTDADEQALLKLLLSCEEDLADLDEPIAFPVFGRGRVLLPLIGKGINRDTIGEASAFLVGACSCRVKELNPGFDLLVTVDWRKELPWVDPATVTPGAGGPSVPRVAELVPIPRGSADMSQSAAPVEAETATAAADSADADSKSGVAAATAAANSGATPAGNAQSTGGMPLLVWGALPLFALVMLFVIRGRRAM